MDSPAARWLQRFMRHLTQERRLSSLTCAAYARDLRGLERFCELHALPGWNNLDSADVRAFASLPRSSTEPNIDLLLGNQEYLSFLTNITAIEGVIGISYGTLHDEASKIIALIDEELGAS